MNNLKNILYTNKDNDSIGENDFINLLKESYELLVKENKKLNFATYIKSWKEIENEVNENIKKEKPLASIVYGMKSCVNTDVGNNDASSNILKKNTNNISAEIKTILDSFGSVMICKTNSDEFSCGSTNSNSIYGPCYTYDDNNNLVCPGGSSGGSAVLAKYFSHFAIGTDTGGSCRLPAIINRIFGFKPTFGSISRFGIIEYGSSLDTIGIISSNLLDIELIYSYIAKFDNKDNCSIHNRYKLFNSNIENSKEKDLDKEDRKKDLNNIIEEKKYENFNNENKEEDIQVIIINIHIMNENQQKFIKNLKFKNKLIELNFDFSKINKVYNILSSVEFMSNTYKYDTLKYVNHSNIYKDIKDIYKQRYDYISDNNIKKILQGATLLCNSEMKKYYYFALEYRTFLIHYFNKIINNFKNVLFIMPDMCRKNKIEKNNFDESYLIISNLLGNPSITIPLNQKYKSESINLICKQKGESLLFYCAKKIINNEQI